MACDRSHQRTKALGIDNGVPRARRHVDQGSAQVARRIAGGAAGGNGIAACFTDDATQLVGRLVVTALLGIQRFKKLGKKENPVQAITVDARIVKDVADEY